ncbi:ATP-binding domain-containing protein [Gordonia sp. (in: high G+C Gram-positive bacteria)]|uniref:HelD family protein n=1 Tax=Gordonia sp. (in: high G+C Gram-positive bacteria) TaxID=84139 RepID=UPI0019CA3C19|nr:ATP-binding domain-containing protein [Gordonia sp. (in: high G+C Gram-positive bacteria)]MBD0022925.1 ATP-binding domain-containing protein [Gordonia sp. (in: high G+C Gram-positive bacteria)]
MGADDPVGEEQAHLDLTYARLDRMRANTRRRLSEALRETEDNPQALSERESYERLYTDDLTKFDAAEHNLYFGRLDLDDGEIRRIGRIGILDDDAADSTLLLDWRAPLSRPFYLATPAAPESVELRRHIRTRNRMVRAINDEYLTGERATDTVTAHGDVVNESALVAALNAARTGEMTDIVETIQREQDIIIRSTHRGVTVIQGGPGTGKTAVALHRAAYLLYTHRDTLSRSGILIVGPNDDFLNYIGQVLPSLGESGVLLSTVGDLFPGVRAGAGDSRETMAVKGDPRMVDVIKRAVRGYQSLPTRPVPVTFATYQVRITSDLVKEARAKARGSRKAHNQGQRIFLRAGLDGLAQAHARTIGASLLDGSQLLSPGDIADIRDEMAQDPDIRRELLRFWPTLTPLDVLRDLYADPAAIRRATPGWSDDDRRALHRTTAPLPEGADLSPADVPLLDEIAELIGFGTEDDEREQRAQWRRRLAEAQEALDILTGSAPQDLEDDLDPEILMAYDLIDAEQLAERQTRRRNLTTAERAVGDRQWAFGHVIVDEAQELSAMAWRMVMRRIPNRWMTIIGDTAQTGDLAGTRSWQAVLEPYVAKRWQLRELTVNYRTPAEITRYANRVLHHINPEHSPPTSLRSNGIEPYAIAAGSLSAAVAAIDPDWPGLTAIIAPDDECAAIAEALTGQHPDSVRVLTVLACKGLEFDNVVVVEPAAILRQSPRGHSDLYVALTRATQRLVVVHDEPLPEELAGMRPAGTSGV